MVKHTPIATALRTCPCCSDNLEAGDFPRAGDFAQQLAVAFRYGAEACNACTDAHAVCNSCDKALAPDEARHHDGYVECEDCDGKTDAEIAADLRHARQERTR
jgi:hypothetical protein